MGVTVSVIVPAYNAQAFVATAVRSALGQTLRDLEVIVVDDGSSDGTAASAEAAGAGDPRLQVLRQPNGGVSAARNTGLRVARGTWLAPLDADDAYRPDRLDRLVAAAEALDADLLADDVVLVRDGSAPERMYAFPPHAARRPVGAREFIARESPTCPLGFMKPLVRRAFVERHGLRYPDGVETGEDFEFYVRALLHGARLLHVPEPLYLATERMGSLTRSDSGPIFAAFGRSAERLQQEAERRGDRAAARLLGRRARDVGSYGDYDRLSDALHRGRIRDAARLLWRLSARRYTWRRLGGALRRRLLPARF